MSIYVFDSSALIAFFNDEEGADNVEKILLQNNDHFISIINVFEICYDAAKRSGYDIGIQMFEEIKQLPIKIIFEIKQNVVEKAVYFKTNFKVSVADAIALGLAKVNDASIVTSDHHEFDCIDEAKEIKFSWFR